MLDELLSSATAEMERLDQTAPTWRAGLLRKAIYDVEPEQRPVPDGLSRAYIELATDLGEADRAQHAKARALETSALLVWLEGLVQAEVARAVGHEYDLLKRAVR